VNSERVGASKYRLQRRICRVIQISVISIKSTASWVVFPINVAPTPNS
jgi:hypothetical protein